jgi:hypothetical protein
VKNRQGTWYRAGYPRAGTARAAVDFEGQNTIVVWFVRLIVTGNALCSLLHRESIRRHDQKAQKRTSIKEWESLPVESSVDKGPADVEEIGEHRDSWTPNSTASNQWNNAHRRSRRGLWWNAGRRGESRGPWTVAGSRDMEREGQRGVHFGQGTHGNTSRVHGNTGRTREERGNSFIEALRRQFEYFSGDKRICGVQQAHDEGTLSLE